MARLSSAITKESATGVRATIVVIVGAGVTDITDVADGDAAGGVCVLPKP